MKFLFKYYNLICNVLFISKIFTWNQSQLFMNFLKNSIFTKTPLGAKLLIMYSIYSHKESHNRSTSNVSHK